MQRKKRKKQGVFWEGRPSGHEEPRVIQKGGIRFKHTEGIKKEEK